MVDTLPLAPSEVVEELMNEQLEPCPQAFPANEEQHPTGADLFDASAHYLDETVELSYFSKRPNESTAQ